MADRAFVFSNPEIQSLLKEKFIPLAMNDWYLRRQEDEIGQFYRKMTEASPRGNVGTATRQGRYAFTPAGKFLGFNNNRSPERILAMLRESLAAWEKLPESERKPSKPLSAAHADEKFHREPPAGGAIIRVFTRQLQKTGETYAACEASDSNELKPTGFEAARDYFWLQSTEIDALHAAVAAGKPTELPKSLTYRLLRYNTVDNTRGEPPSWKLGDIRTASLQMTPNGNQASLEGEFHAHTVDGKRGVSGKWSGTLAFTGKKLATFTLLGLGEHWGEAENTRGARPGKQPIGFSFNLCPDPSPAEKIAPQFSHWLKGYWDADRD